MSDILDKVREKYPSYEQVNDDDLTLALASKYPQYLRADKDFQTDFKRISQQRKGTAIDASLTSFGQMQPGTIAPVGGKDFAAIKDVPPDTQDSLAPVLPPTPAIEPRLPVPELSQFQPPRNDLSTAGLGIGQPIEEPPDFHRLPLGQRTPTPGEFFQVPTSMPLPKASDLEGQLAVTALNPINTPNLNRFLGKTVAGAERFGAGLGDFMTSPGGFATVITGGVAGEAAGIGRAASSIYGEALQAGEGGERARLLGELAQNVGRTGRAMSSGMSKAFAADMARHLPELTSDVMDRIKKGDTAGATEGILNGLLTLTAITGTAYHTTKERAYAKAIRSDTRQPEVAGLREQGSEADRRRNLQQAPSGAPNAPTPQAQPPNVPQITEDEYADAERRAIAEAEQQGSPVKVVDSFSDENAPFNNRFIARAFKHGIEINRGAFRQWLAETPPERRQEAIKSVMSEEHIHRHVTDEDAKSYWDTLTGLEKAAETYQYTGFRNIDRANEALGINLNDTALGHEAVRRRLQKLYGSTPTEIAEAAFKERWTLKTVDAMSTLLRKAREAIGTEAAGRGIDIIERAQKNLDFARSALVAKQTADEQGLMLDTTPQIGAVKLEGLPPELQAKMEAAMPKQWGFTDQQSGLTFYTKEGATRQEILDAWKSKQSAPGALRRDAPISQKDYDERIGDTIRDLETQASEYRELAANAGNEVNRLRYQREADRMQADADATKARNPNWEQMAGPAALRRRKTDEKTGALPLLPGATREERASASELGAEPVTPEKIASSGYEHLTSETDRVTEAYTKNPDAKITPPSFENYVNELKRKYGDVQPGQLYESFSENLYKRLFNASGKTLEALQRSLGITVKGRIPDPAPKAKALLEIQGATPAARAQMRAEAIGAASRQKYRVGAIRIIADKLLGEAQERTKPTKTAVSQEDIRFKGKSQQPPFFDVSSQDLRDPSVLSQRLTADSRRSNRDPVSLTKRVTALLDKQTGKVFLVSTYPHGRSGAMLLDPSLSTARAHKPLSQILTRYRPVASMLLDEPVRDFRQSFDTLGDFERKIGTGSRNVIQDVIQPTPVEGDVVSGPTTGRYAVPGIYQDKPGTFEGDAPITDAEAGAVLDHILAESSRFDSPEDVKASLEILRGQLERQTAALKKAYKRDFIRETQPLESTRQALSGYRKLAAEIIKKNPDLSNDGVLRQLAQNIYENHTAAAGETAFETFKRRTMAQGGASVGEDVATAGSSAASKTARELTMRERRPPTDVRPENIPAEEAAKLGTKPAPPVPEGTLKPAKSAPGALRRYIPKSLEDDVMASADAIRYSMQSGVAEDLIARSFDDASNLPHNQARQTENDIRIAAAVKPASKVKQAATTWEMGDKKILAGANPLVYSGAVNQGGTIDMPLFQNKLAEFQQLVDAGKADAQTMLQSQSWRQRRIGRAKQRYGEQLQAELDYARAHASDPQLIRTALEAQRARNRLYTQLRQAGIDVTYKDNFLPGRYDMSADTGGNIWFQQPRIWGTRWREPKVFNNYYEAFAVPGRAFIAATRDIASLIGHATRTGLELIQRNQTLDFVKNMRTPDGLPMAGDAVIAASGAHVPPQGMAGYDLVKVGGKMIAVHPDFSSFVRQMTSPSVIEDLPIARQILHFEQFLKHNLLLGDFFHLGRISYYAAAIMGRKMGYSGGLSALDYSERSLPEAVRKGIISQKQADWGMQQIPYGNSMITRRELLRRAQSGAVGFNVGRIQDALYKDIYNNLTPTSGVVKRSVATITDPTSGRYNRFLFDKLTRGLMAESLVNEFERQSKANPGADPKALLRDISRDLNNFYGNIGRQGWIKSKTMQDFARIFVLAPQWVEGLVKKEAVGASRLTGLSALTGQRKGLATFGTTGKGMATGLVAAFGLAQAINIISRGQPTWMNKEKGHKLDAFIPLGGEEQGLWFSPFSTFAEITHDLWRLTQTKPSFMDALDQIAGNKESPLTRALIIARFGHDDYGKRYTTTGARLKAMGKAIAPVPISFGRLLQAPAHAIAPSLIPPTSSQQIIKQGIASLGIKTEPQETSYQTMKRMADDFNKANNYKPETGWQQVMTDEPSLSVLRSQIRNDDFAGAKRTFQALQKGRSSEQIVKSMKQWSKHPLTGSQKHESEFIQSLTDDELKTYLKQETQRMKTYDKFVDWWVSSKDL